MCEVSRTETELLAEHAVNIFSASLSMAGAVVTVAAFTLRHRLFLKAVERESEWLRRLLALVRHTWRMPVLHRMIIFLALADFGAAASITASHIHMLAINGSYGFHWCVAYRAFIQYFFVASFLWTSLIAVALLLQLYRLNLHLMAHFGITFLGWVLPLIDVLLMTVRPDETMEVTPSGWCDLAPVFEWTFWFGPLLFATLFNMFIFAAVLWKLWRMRSVLSSDVSRATRRHVFNVSLYLVVFFVCWIWDLLDHVLGSLGVCQVELELFYLQSFFIPFQGALNCLIYTFWNPNVKLPGMECVFLSEGPTEELIEAFRLLKEEQEYLVAQGEGADFSHARPHFSSTRAEDSSLNSFARSDIMEDFHSDPHDADMLARA